MAGVLPLFASAPRLTIQVNQQDIAFAIGLSLNVSLDVIPVKILGQFGIKSLEPVMYNPVTGTFRVIRLLSKEQQESARRGAATLKSGYVGGATISHAIDNPGSTNSVLSQSYLHRHLDPVTVLISQTFDITIKLRVPLIKYTAARPAVVDNPATTEVEAAVPAVQGVPVDFINPNGPHDTLVQFMTIKDCRIVGMDGEIAPGRLLEEPLSFQGLLVQNNQSSYVEQLDSVLKDGLRL